jgi:hypothetical protein
MKTLDIDTFRINIYNKLQNLNIKDDFFLFLQSDDFNLFTKWFNICKSNKDITKLNNDFTNIINVFKNKDKIISFKKLQEIDENWKEYFKENLNNKNEPRYGVDKYYVTDIMLIKKYTKLSLDDSILLYFKLKNIFIQKLFI